jgi:hypothetical protein
VAFLLLVLSLFSISLGIDFFNKNHVDLALVVLYLQVSLLSLYGFSQTPYQKWRAKSVCFLILLFNIFFFMDFLLDLFFWEFIFSFRVVFPTIALPVLVSVIWCTFFKSSTDFSANYSAKPERQNSFLVYSKPTNFLSFIASWRWIPFGSVFLVTDNTALKYKRGKLIQKQFIYHQKHCYRKINYIPKHEALERLSSEKWSLTNNCFRIFHRFCDGR